MSWLNRINGLRSKTSKGTWYLFGFFICFGVARAEAVSIASIQNGNWSSTSTWTLGVIPTASDPVTIAAGHTVTIDTMTAVSSTATINGTLRASRVVSSSWTLVGGDIKVNAGGALDYGREGSGIPSSFNAHLVLALGAYAGQYGLIVNNGGNFTVWGSTSSKTPYSYATQNITTAQSFLTVYGSTSIAGWKAGDIIAIGPTSGGGPASTESRTINNITGGPLYSISWSGGFLAQARNLADGPIVIANLTRNVLVRSSGTAAGMDTAYIQNLAQNATSFSLTQGEFAYLGVNTSGKYGITFDGALTKGSISSSTVRNGYHGIYLQSSSNNTFARNTFYANQDSVWIEAGVNNTLAYNNLCASAGDGIYLGGSNNLFTGNNVYSNTGFGVMVNSSADNNTLADNNLYSNSSGLYLYGRNNTVSGNNLYSNQAYGLFLNGSTNTLVANNFYANSQLGFDFSASNGSNSVVIGGGIGYDKAGLSRPNGLAELSFDAGASVETLVLKGVRINPMVGVSTGGMNDPGNYLLSYNQDYSSGTVRLWGNYRLSGSTLTLDYAAQLYPSSATSPKLMRGTGHSASVSMTYDADAVSQLITINYRGGQWHADGSVSGADMIVFPGTLFSMDVPAVNPQVKINFTSGGSPQEGDTVDLVLIAASNDANSRKRLLFGPAASSFNNGRSKLEADSTGGIVLRGKADGTANTLVDWLSSASTYYTFVDSGAFTAEYSSFTNMDQDGIQLSGAGGVAISSSAFDYLGFAPGTNTYLTMRGLSTDATFYNVTFGMSRPSAGYDPVYNVRVEGADSGLAPVFRKSAAFLGPLWGEAYDYDPGARVTWSGDSAVVPGCASGFNVGKDGSWDYTDIQAAVDALDRNLTGDTCVVIRDTSTYFEQVTVQGFTNNGYRLKIMRDPELGNLAPVIDPPVAAMAAFRLMNASVTVQGINIFTSNPVPYGILASSDSVNISSVNVMSGVMISSAGIQISNRSAVSYSSVTVQAANGLQITGSNNAVSFSGMTSNSADSFALYLAGADSNTVTWSDISNLAGYGAALYTGADYNTISDSTMTAYGGDHSALAIVGSSSNIVTRSYMYNPASWSAALGSGAAYNTISYSTITSVSASDSALYIRDSVYNTLAHAYISNQSGEAVVLEGGAGNTISDSVITSNGAGYDALYLNGSSSNTVTRSGISSPYGGGAYLRFGSHYNTISDSTIKSDNSLYPALIISGSSSNTVSGSYVQGSTAAYILGSTGTVIRGSVFVTTSTAGYAFMLAGGSVGLALSSSVFTGGAQGAGIYLDADNSGVIDLSSNTITGGKYGLNVAAQAAGAALSVSSMTFQSLTAGATAINFLGGQFMSTFTAVAFNSPGISANVNAVLLGAGSRVTMRQAAGSKAGAFYELDPLGVVDWDPLPAGCGIGLNVTKNGTGNFLSIQAAVDALPVSLSANTCVVIRDTQTYSEEVTVQGFVNNGYRLTIMADPAFVSSAPAIDPPVSSTAAFRITSSSISIQGINVVPTSAMPYGILASGAWINISSANIISGGKINSAGIQISSLSSVANSNINVQAADGLRLTGSGNQVAFSTMTCANYAKVALSLAGSDNNTVAHSYIANTTGSGARLDSGADLNTISDSTIIGSLSGLYALYVGGSSSNTVSGSYARGYTSAHVSGSTGTIIGGSVFEAADNAGYAFALLDGSLNLSLSSNTFSGGPQGAGIYLYPGNSGAITLSSNTVTGGKYGLNIAAQSAGTALSISSMTFQSLTPGATAVNFLGGQLVSTFTGVSFSAVNIAVNINAGPLTAGSRITVHDSTGPRDGAAFENDPADYVEWDDLVPPTVFILNPAQGALINSFAELTGTFADNGAVSIVRAAILNEGLGLYWNGSAWSPGLTWLNSNVYASSWTYTSLPPLVDASSYTVAAKAQDAAGNWSVVYATNTFTADTTSPVVSVSTPVAERYYGANAAEPGYYLSQMGGFSSDAFGIDRAEVQFYDVLSSSYWHTTGWVVNVSSWQNAGDEVWSYTAPALRDGYRYRLEARAFDMAGNISALATSYFNYDSSEPAAVMTAPGTTGFYNSLPQLDGTALDPPGGGVYKSDMLKVDVGIQENPPAGLWWTGASFSSAAEVWLQDTSHTWPDWTLSGASTPAWVTNTKYRVESRAMDVARNTSTIVTQEFVYDTQVPPAALITSPSGAEAYLGALPYISGTAADVNNLGEIAEVSLRVKHQNAAAYWSWDTRDFTISDPALAWFVVSTTETVPYSKWFSTGTPPGGPAGISFLSGFPYEMNARAMDKAGNYSSVYSTRTITYDAQKPTGAITALAGSAPMAYQRQMSPLSGTGYDPGGAGLALLGAGGAQLRILEKETGLWWNDGAGNFSAADGNAAWFDANSGTSEIWSYAHAGLNSALVNGRNYLAQYKGRDNSVPANTGPSSDGVDSSFTLVKDSVTFVFDSEGPFSSPMLPGVDTAYNSLPVITGTSYDNGSGMQSAVVSIYGEETGKYFNGTAFAGTADTWLPVTALYPSSWTYSSGAAAFIDGEHYIIKSSATDNTGNVQTTNGQSRFLFDAAEPQSVVTVPLNGIVYEESKVLSGTSSDTGFTSGIDGTGSGVVPVLPWHRGKIETLVFRDTAPFIAVAGPMAYGGWDDSGYFWDGSTWTPTAGGAVWVQAQFSGSPGNWDYAGLTCDNDTERAAHTCWVKGAPYFSWARVTDNAGNVEAVIDQGPKFYIAASARSFSAAVDYALPTAGQDITLTVTAKDGLNGTGGTANAYQGTVNFYLDGVSGGPETMDDDGVPDDLHGLPKQYTFVPGDYGQKTFLVRARKAGARVLNIEDMDAPTIFGAQNLTVNPAEADRVQVIADYDPAGQLPSPGRTEAGVEGSTGTPRTKPTGSTPAFLLQVTDKYWNLVVSSAASVYVTDDDPNNAAPSPDNFVDFVGSTTIYRTFVTAAPGGWTVSAAGWGVYPNARNPSSGVMVLSQTADRLVAVLPGETRAEGKFDVAPYGKTGTPSPLLAGTTFAVMVYGVDIYYNTDAAASFQVKASIPADPYDVDPADQSLFAGVTTFIFTPVVADTQTIKIESISLPSATSSYYASAQVWWNSPVKLHLLAPGQVLASGKPPYTSNPATGGRLGSPSQLTAGVTAQMTVYLVDQYYNVVKASTPFLAVSSNTPLVQIDFPNDPKIQQRGMHPTPYQKSLIAGATNFSVIPVTSGLSGGLSVQVADTGLAYAGTWFSTDTVTGLVVNPGPLDHLAFYTAPRRLVAGTTVQYYDYNARITTPTVVSAALKDIYENNSATASLVTVRFSATRNTTYGGLYSSAPVLTSNPDWKPLNTYPLDIDITPGQSYADIYVWDTVAGPAPVTAEASVPSDGLTLAQISQEQYIAPGPATHFTLHHSYNQTSQLPINTPGGITLRVRDQFGNIAAGDTGNGNYYSGKIRMGTNSGGAVILRDLLDSTTYYTFVTADAGERQLFIQGPLVETLRVSVTDYADPGLYGYTGDGGRGLPVPSSEDLPVYAVPPDPVTSLSVGVPDTNIVTLSWVATGNDGGSGTLNNSTFTLQYATYTSVNWSTAAAQVNISTTGVNPGDGQVYELGGLAANTSYYFRIWIKDDAAAYSALSNGAAQLTSIEAPTDTIFGSVSSSTIMTLAYALAGFTNLDRGLSGISQARDGVYGAWEQTAAAVFSGLTPNTLYNFKAKARNQNGVESPESAQVSTYTLAEAPVLTGAPLIHVSSVAVSWTPVDSAGYLVEASTSPGLSGVVLSSSSLNPSVFGLSVPGLSPNTTYYFRAGSLNSAGAINYGGVYGESTYVIQPGSAAVFAAVSSVAVTVEWLPNGNGPGTRYLVKISSDNFTNVSASSITSGQQLTTGGLSPNTTYWFSSQAMGNRGDISEPLLLGSTVTAPVPPALSNYGLWESSAAIVWDPNGNGAGTVYECGLSTSPDFSAVLSSLTYNQQLEVGDLLPNTSYYMRLRALSAVTGQASAYVTDLKLSLAAAPEWLAAFTLGPNNAWLYWDSVRNPGGVAGGSWSGAGSLPAARYGHAAAVSGDAIFLTGGSDGSGHKPGVWSAPFSANGQIGAWTSGRALPAARYGHTAAALKGRLYIIGGYDGTAARSEVWSAPVSSFGALGEWVAETPLPQAVFAHASAVFGDNLYVLGGYGAGAKTEVWRAPVNGDGTLGGWTAATPLPQAVYAHAAVLSLSTSAARLYVAGGTDGNSARAEVWTARINGDASLSAWASAAALPSPLFAHSLAAVPGALFAAGGNNGSTARSAALRAAANPDGTLGAWTAQPALPQAIQSHAMIGRGGRLLVLGGYDGAVSKQDVWMSLITGTEYTLSVTGASFSSTPWAAAGNLEVGGLKPNTFYTFSAAARNYSGAETGYSPALSTYTCAAQPSTAAFGGVWISSIQVNWLVNDNPGGTVYNVELSSDAAHTQLAGAFAVTGSSSIFSGLADGYTYYARVRAVNDVNVYTAWTSLGSTTTRTNPVLDLSSPTITNNQAVDNTWRNSSGGAYDIDFDDSGGAYLSKFQVRASTVPGGAGPFSPDWSDVVTDINSNSYSSDFGLPAPVFNLLQPGTNYVSVRVFDGNCNSSAAVDAFYVLKDTVAPVIADNQTGETAWRMDDAGAVYDVDFADELSGLGGIDYSASVNQGAGDAAALAWTPITALSPGTSSYNAAWAVDFAALVNDATNYISVRVWDLAGNTVTVSGVDVFKILKYVSGPEVAITAPAGAYQATVAAITGTASAARSHALAGTELSFMEVSSGRFWDGTEFLASAPLWLAVPGGAAWSYAPAIPWTDGVRYQAVARSSDVAGNYSVAYATSVFTLDAVSPALTSLAPADGGTVNSLPSISGTVSDVSGASVIGIMFKRISDDKWWDFGAGTWTAAGSSAAVAAAEGWSYSPGEVLKASLETMASYYFTLYAADNSSPANAVQFGVYGSTFVFLDDTAPAAIADLSAAAGNSPGGISLDWHAPGDDGASGTILYGRYRIQYSTSLSVEFTTAAAQISEVFTLGAAGSARYKELTALAPGETYYLRVWTMDDAGNWSALSNGAAARSAAYPDRISGHVMKVSSEGITGVLVEAFDTAGTLQASGFTVADGSGSYVLSHLPSGSYKVQATWTADDIISSVGTDGIALGASDADFTLAINYELASIGGELTGYRIEGAGYRVRNAGRNAVVELYQRNRLIASAPVDAAGKFLIRNLLPGKYTLKVPDVNGVAKELSVSLKPGEALMVNPLGELLREDKVYAFPNPARRSVTFHLESEQSPVIKQLTVFDITGRAVKEFNDGDFVARNGGYEADWDIPSKVASGVYIYSVRVKFEATGDYRKKVKKFAIVR